MAGHKSILESIELSCTNNRHKMAIKQCTDALRSSDLTPDLARRLIAWRRNCFRNHLGEYPIHRRLEESCGGFGVVISIDDDSRPGGKVDRGRMVSALKSVGCQKVLEEGLVNRAAVDMEEAMAFVMANEEENQFASVDWFVCVIMAHGKVMENVLHIKATDGEFVPVFDKLISPVVKNHHLNNKPKVFFIQACREVEQAQGEESQPLLESAAAVGSDDVLICFATLHGAMADRYSGGTPFITQLSKILCDRAVMERQHLLDALQPLKGSDSGCHVTIVDTLRHKCFWRSGLPPLPEERHAVSNLRVTKNPKFRGREEEMARLEALLCEHRIVSVWAMAGMGKSQLVVEYAHKHLHEYDWVLWVDGGAPEDLSRSFGALAKNPLKLPLEGKEEGDLACKEVKKFLERAVGDKCLLLLDNVERKEDVRDLVPVSGACHVLLTTKTKGLGGWKELELGPLGEAEAWALVAEGKDFGGETDALKALCVELENLTLELAVLSGILHTEGTRPSRVLERLRKGGDWPSDRAEDPTFSRDARLQVLFDESLKAMERACPAEIFEVARAMVLAGGWFAPSPIRVPLLALAASAGLGRKVAAEVAEDRARPLLVRYSLASGDDRALRFHRLVQHYSRLKAPAMSRAVDKALREVGEVERDTEHFRVVWQRFVESEDTGKDARLTVYAVGLELAWHAGIELWLLTECEQVLEQCRRKMDFLSHKGAASFMNCLRFKWSYEMSCLRFKWSYGMGWLRFRQGRYADAECLFRAVVAQNKKTLLWDKAMFLSCRGGLATMIGAQGRYAEAEQEHRAVLAARERLLGVEHPDTRASHRNVAVAVLCGSVHSMLQECDATNASCRERIATFVEGLAHVEHPSHVSDALNSVAWRIAKTTGGMQALGLAEAMARKAVEIDRQVRDGDVARAAALDTLAVILSKLGRLEEAVPVSEEAVGLVESGGWRDGEGSAKAILATLADIRATLSGRDRKRARRTSIKVVKIAKHRPLWGANQATDVCTNQLLTGEPILRWPSDLRRESPVLKKWHRNWQDGA